MEHEHPGEHPPYTRIHLMHHTHAHTNTLKPNAIKLSNILQDRWEISEYDPEDMKTIKILNNYPMDLDTWGSFF